VTPMTSRRLPRRLAPVGAAIGAALAIAASVAAARSAPPRFRLLTLDPGHFHAALVQKFMYPDVDSTVHVYAPAGDDLEQHLARVEGFNKRAEAPTAWREAVYRGPDFFERMIAERKGNVVVIAGNNARKGEYILKSVQAGLNVLGDKPMAATPQDLQQLRRAFTTAAAKRVLLYDIMTERNEVTNALQRELATRPALFGTLRKGTAAEPAIVMESVHYLSKTVAGSPLRRPLWFFDVKAQGEGMQDVGTHLVDLVQWEAFPGVTLKESDVAVLSARRWATPVTREQFRKVTGADDFPPFLRGEVKNGALQYYSNGEMTYRIRGVHAKVVATWDFEAAPGSGDTHHSIFRGTKATIEIRQGAAEKYKPTLYVQRDPSVTPAAHEAALRAAVASVQAKWPGVDLRRAGDEWALVIPAKYDVGHEAHFAQVTSEYLGYLRAGKLPAWEVPNMLVKYATTMKAYEMTRGGSGNAP
jgi:predicted dehydrogenase